MQGKGARVAFGHAQVGREQGTPVSEGRDSAGSLIRYGLAGSASETRLDRVSMLAENAPAELEPTQAEEPSEQIVLVA